MSKLEIGDLAPDFSGVDQNGKEISKADFAGKKLVIYFYPKDDTPGCTAQACNLRDNYGDLQKAGYQILGVSTDGEKSHDKFVKKYELPFPLFADTDKKMVESYGVWVEKSMYGKKYMGTSRVTFVIDADGKIEKIIEKVDTKDHTNQILS